jgi:hypothetical protein
VWHRGLFISVVISLCVCGASAAQASVAAKQALVGSWYVPAATAPPGINTGIWVAPGSTVEVAGSGLAYYGPDYCTPSDDHPSTNPDGIRPGCGQKYDPGATLPSSPIGELIAKTGCDSSYSAVGTGGEFKSKEGGDLYLLYNDSFYGDNSGGYYAKITVLPPPANYAAPAVCNHYDVEMQAWIPQRKVVDPLYPAPFPALTETPYVQIAALLAAAGDPPGCLTGPALPPPDAIVSSVYRGDGHSDYGTGSYREAREVVFDSDGSHVFNMALQSLKPALTVRTHRIRTLVKASSCMDTATDTEEAPSPTSSGNTFTLQYDAKNALAALADPLAAELSGYLNQIFGTHFHISTPPIQGVISGTVGSSGALELTFSHGTFPSIGLQVKINGSVALRGEVNDVSCLSQGNVLGFGGAYRLTRGLNTFTNTRLVAVPGRSSTIDIHSPLCIDS